MVCFFKDTATTEIYTYGHTLSLHDALPICPPTVSAIASTCRSGTPNATAASGRELTAYNRSSPLAPSQSRNTAPLSRVSCVRKLRSEEHTSELQSLMRISYAVFCLKTKKYIT